jgi:murein DD-endopeptidase MepM/ murein hydrolase activator NlpD
MVIAQQTTSSSDGTFLGTVGRLDLMRWEREDLFEEMWSAPAPLPPPLPPPPPPPPPNGDHEHKDLEAGIASNTVTIEAHTLGFQLMGNRFDYLEARVKELEESEPPPEPIPDRLRLRWPADAPKIMTQGFGINPQWYNPFGLPGHEGLDFRALNGSQVYTMAAGQVYRVQKYDSGPYGIHVRIEHRIGDKIYKTAYAHFMDALVSEGDEVKEGQAIGKANNTGNSYGAHLHVTLKEDGANLKSWMSYMAKNPTTGAAKPNDIVNPVPYMPDLFPGLGWRVDTNGNLRTEPRKTAVNLIRLLRGGEVVQATGETDYDWWQVIAANDVVGWFWNPGYKLSAI